MTFSAYFVRGSFRLLARSSQFQLHPANNAEPILPGIGVLDVRHLLAGPVHQAHDFDVKNLDVNPRQSVFSGNPLKPDLSRYKKTVTAETHSTAKPATADIVPAKGATKSASGTKVRVKPASN